MILYGSSMSPFVRKVLAFAGEKGIELELKPLGIGNQDPEFREASPFGKIPALRDGDFTLAESTAIIVYLDALTPEPNLIPTEARARARTFYWDEFADGPFAGCGVKMFFNRIVGPRFMNIQGDEDVASKAETQELPPLLAYLESVVPDSLYLVEDRLTLADLAVASPFVNLKHLGLPVDASRYPRLAAYVEKMHALPSFARWIDKETRFFAKVAAAQAPAAQAN